MSAKEWISKKELLNECGISYGQLYRWKREGLIPDDWFIKKSSSTGQETYFDKGLIQNRIQTILKLKKDNTIKELMGLLSPEEKDEYKSTDIKKLKGILPSVISLFEKNLKKDCFNLKELIFIYIFSRISTELKLDRFEYEEMATSIKHWLPEIKDFSYRVVVYLRYSQSFIMMCKKDVPVYFDQRTKELRVYELEDILSEINLLFNEINSKIS